MRKSVVTIFDDVVAGTPSFSVYTDVRYNEILGQFDKLSIHVITDQVTNITAFTIDLEDSNDGRNWHTKNASWVSHASLAANNQYQDTATDAGTTPMLALGRLKITATTGTAGSLHMKIAACLRDDS